MELERDVEQYLVSEVSKHGGLCVKFIPDHRRGMPDRIVMLPTGVLVWVETKRPKDGEVSAVQKHRHKELRALGQTVVLCYTKADIDKLMAAYA